VEDTLLAASPSADPLFTNKLVGSVEVDGQTGEEPLGARPLGDG